MIIYLTTNLINGKMYIGLDTKNNENYLGSGLILKQAIEKYGKENFKKETLEECKNKEELYKREKYWINYYNSFSPIGYNIADGGFGGDTMSHHPNKIEIFKNISKNRIGKYKGRTYEDIYGDKADEHREKRRLGLFGKKYTKERCKNISKQLKGKIPWNKGLTKETDERVKKYVKNRVHKKYIKRYEIQNTENNEIFIFNGLYEVVCYFNKLGLKGNVYANALSKLNNYKKYILIKKYIIENGEKNGST